ncbi:MAG: hypothetical protein ABEJ02_04775 [Candidatus Paceibacteria bacterium]
MHKNLDIQEFFIEGDEREKSHVLLHITEPTTPEEKRKGYFFAVAEIENGTVEQIRHVQKMIDDLESGFYETEDTDEDPFESTLEYINKRSHKILKYEDSKVHCFVAAVKENEVSFAYHGEPQAFLFYNDNKGYQQLELIEEEENQKDQLFSAVIEGEIHTGDVFYIGTPNIEKLLSNSRLKSLISNNTIVQGAQHIQRSLTGFKPELSFGGILFQPKDKPDKDTTTTTTSDTETNYRPGKQNRNEGEGMPQKAVVSLGKVITKGVKWLFRWVAKIFIAIKDAFVALAILITNRGGQRKTIVRSIKRGIEDKKRSFKELPWLSKILLIVAVLSALIFAGSITYIKYKENREAAIKSYKNKVQAIKDKKNKAQAELIYDKDNKALKLLKEAKTLTAKLPQGLSSKEGLTPKEELRKKIIKEMNKVKKIEQATPKTIAKINEKNNSLVSTNNKLIAFGTDTNKFDVFDLSSKEKISKSHSEFSNLTLAAASKDSNNIIFQTKDNTAVKMDGKSLELTKQEIFYPNDNINIADISTYAGNLYVLDSKNQQIYKHTPIEEGFSKGTNWLNDSTAEAVDLSQARSLAIDGNIYVLSRSGQIFKFFKGNKEKLEVESINPKLNNPTQLWTNSELDHLYVLEPKNNRVIIFNKNGGLIKQIKSDKWKDIQSMVIKEKQDKGYVIDKNQIFEFNLNL